MNHLNILHINLFDCHGGAARIASTLNSALHNAGHESNIFVKQKSSNDSWSIPLKTGQALWQQKLLQHEREQGLFDLLSPSLFTVLNSDEFNAADVVHVHCINGGYFSYLLLPFINAKPVIWTLHDPLAFTADCLDIDVCSKWQSGWCANCPKDSTSIHKPNRQLVQLIKGSIYQISKLTVAAPSTWILEKAKQSILRGQDFRLIPNGVNTKVYLPGERSSVRKQLGLPIDKKILLFAAHGGFNNSMKGGSYLIDALKRLQAEYPDLLLINIGTVDTRVLGRLSTARIDLPYISDRQLLADYYRAADVFVCPSPMEICSLAILESMACGTPVVAFNTSGNTDIIQHKVTSYLAAPYSSESLAEGLSYFLSSDDIVEKTGRAARSTIEDNFSETQMIDRYFNLYDQAVHQSDRSVWTVPAYDDPDAVIAAIRELGWQTAVPLIRDYCKTIASNVDRSLRLDSFFTLCLRELNIKTDGHVIWELLELWYKYRGLPIRCGSMAPNEFKELLAVCLLLRQKIGEYIVKYPLASFDYLPQHQQVLLVSAWWQLFFNSFSALNLSAGSFADTKSLNDAGDQYRKLLITCMYEPFVSGDTLAIESLWSGSIPTVCKIILLFWLFNVPYYGVGESHRTKVLKHALELSHLQIPEIFFSPLINQLTECFWCLSYVGGDTSGALSAYGDFLHRHAQRFYYPQIKHDPLIWERPEKHKIRVGYISRFFYKQAVSYYMVNRIIHHNRQNFEVQVFALGNNHDEMTELFVRNADQFKRFSHLNDINHIAQSIIDSNLDILIYTDIGMDSVTYTLASMQLCPVQCAMVGHGTTSGLPTIQYYISGNHEAENADSHYREQLIRLPYAGAAQFAPPFIASPNGLTSRKDWNIPDDVTVFISCANGIKHSPNRDQLLVDILREAPTACIILKPYHFSNVNPRLSERIQKMADNYGVGKRLFIIPPLKDISALLAIADVQLDTYPYGGWTTNLEALYMGLPIVTQEGNFARSRWGAGLLRTLGVDEGIAKNETEYVQWAVRFATDPDLRLSVRAKILAKQAVLFNGEAVQPYYEAALIEMIK